MEQYIKYSLFYFCLIIILWSCRETNKNQPIALQQFPSITFEDFGEITDNHPDRYISNPDSFLNTTHLTPKDDYENAVYAYGLVMMAYNLRENGRIFKSIQYYERALNFAKIHTIADFDIGLYILKPLSALYINVDDNQKAIGILEDLVQSQPIQENTSGLINNLANAYIYNHESNRAIKLLSKHIIEKKTSVHKALSFNSLATAYAKSQDTINSIRYNEYAIAEFEKFELRRDTLIWYCSALTQYAELHHSSKQAVKAIEILNHNFAGTQYRNKANAHLSLASIYFEDENYDAALKSYTKAFENFRQGNSKYFLDYKYTYTLLGLARSYKAQNQSDSALYYYEWAVENDFRTQQLITSEANQLINNVWNKSIIEELIELYSNNPTIHSSDNRKTLLWCIELSKARLLINEINRSDNWTSASNQVKSGVQQIRQFYQRLDASESEEDKKNILEHIAKLKIEFDLSERYFENINFNPSKDKFLNRILNNNNAYYSYYIHTDKSLSILYNIKNDISLKRINDKSIIDSLNNFKTTYFNNSPKNFNNNPDRYKDLAKHYSQILLPQLDKKQSDVFLSLDGSLYGIPFDALYREDFLVKNHNFAYLNSFLLFDFITNNTSTHDAEISLLYRSEYPKPLPHLEFVKEEVNNLTTKFKTLAIPPPLQNDSTIREAFTKINIIHIAAHTILDSIEAPNLYLHQAISTNQLRFFDINTPLVFLSACNTGSGRPLPSEGTESIQRVFMSKNVPSVISTYWFANDEVMLNLTSNFYNQLQESKNPMVALADAKRNFLKQASAQRQNPWYWANINYTGIGNKVGLKKSSNLPIVIMGLTIFALIGFFTFKRLSRSNKISI
ncbi:CHAT domain-containing protein [Sphingobacterium bovistauri]|uniref:CHAT domain-containing protein n=1 Tax=Sphingobacterium bovistauri TaxID=2781959 RepID=A0ABS7Z8A8_9SPHI|nr:CHAT domain-containing protein [Sphingobacterium bovistauri]MCA5006435.1 CHAT domain-containing protein [Sphingobacterium bovistauri]